MFVTECDLVCMGPSFGTAIERYVAALEAGEWPTPASDGDHESNAWVEWLNKHAKKPKSKSKSKSKPKSKSKSKSR